MARTAPAANDAELRAMLAQVTTATASAMLYKRGYPKTFMLGATPIQKGVRVCGRAVTLRLGPGRPDLATAEEDRNTKDPMWLAIESLGEGDVLVIDCGGDQSGATTGDILAARIKRLGAVAIVGGGAVRDAAQIAEVGLEQEHKETFIRGLVQEGVPVSECYPPNKETLRKYEAWKKEQGR